MGRHRSVCICYVYKVYNNGNTYSTCQLHLAITRRHIDRFNVAERAMKCSDNAMAVEQLFFNKLVGLTVLRITAMQLRSLGQEQIEQNSGNAVIFSIEVSKSKSS